MILKILALSTTSTDYMQCDLYLIIFLLHYLTPPKATLLFSASSQPLPNCWFSNLDPSSQAPLHNLGEKPIVLHPE